MCVHAENRAMVQSKNTVENESFFMILRGKNTIPIMTDVHGSQKINSSLKICSTKLLFMGFFTGREAFFLV
jgi:hypothetical protein